MKRVLLVLTLVVLLTAALVIGASAETTSGTCGENLTWKFENKVLTISGTGDMYDYEEKGAPWEGLNGINKWVIEYGVTSIGNNAFNTSRRAAYATVAASVGKIGAKAFANVQCSIHFLGSAPEIAPDAFENSYGTCRYVFGWEESDLQSYGGTQKWVKGDLERLPSTKMVYALNEQIKPEDFQYRATFNGSYAITYTPQTLETELYDNSVLGEKSVKVMTDGLEFTHTYFVSDGATHLDAVRVKKPNPVCFDDSFGNTGGTKVEPVVHVGSLVLTKGTHYTLSFNNNDTFGTKAAVTVTGIGEFAGFSETVYFTILKKDIDNDTTGLSVHRTPFEGVPVIPEVSTWNLTGGEDYVAYFENNVNMGDASYRVIGTGNYCGSIAGTFQITDNSNRTVTLEGAYNGQADGTLDTEKYAYQELVWAPGPFQGRIDCVVNHYSRDHVAYYQLYQMVGEEMVLIHEEQTEFGHWEATDFEYDFSHVYEGSMDEGGEVYMLSYSWVNEDYGVYSGVCVILVPAKVSEATQMVAEVVKGVGDFRYAYLTAYGLDGNVGNVTWTSSDPAVATVENGIVTMKTLGTVTFTVQYGDLAESVTLMILPEDLTKAEVCNYDAETGKAYVYYDGQLLEEGTDYTYCVSTRAGESEVTVTGINLFEGQLVQYFDEDGQAVDHSHGFDNSCDPACNSCDFVREAGHTYKTRWSRDQESHWHSCAVCGHEIDREVHRFETPDVCTVCGPLKVEGDLDKNYELDENDAIHLLKHVLLPTVFTVDQPVDYDHNNAIDEDDVIYLLQNLLLPEEFPLS